MCGMEHTDPILTADDKASMLALIQYLGADLVIQTLAFLVENPNGVS